MAEYLRKITDHLPCLTVLAGVSCGIAALYFCELPDRETVFLTSLCFLFPGWFLLGTRRALIRFALPMLAAAVASCLAVHHRISAFMPESLNWNYPVGVELEVRLKDPGLTGGRPAWMPAFPNNIEAEAVSFRYTELDISRPCKVRILLHLPESASAPEYDDLWRISGVLERIEGNDIPGAFDFRSYALSRGIEWKANAFSAKKIRSGNGFMKSLFRFRSFLLEKLSSGMTDHRSKELAAAILFGMKQCPSADEKAKFRESGTIHLLSVSGLHVSLIFGILALFFKAAPFRVRFLLILIPVSVYALASGLQTPVLRALLMFSIWCICRTFCIRTPILNSILAAASLMLILNPYLYLDIGFRYSFLCVLFLLLAFDLIQEIRTAVRAKRMYRPLKNKRDPVSFAASWLAESFSASCAAWLCSSAISMYSQGLLTVFAVPAYLLMSFSAWLSFSLFTFGVVFCFVPGAVSMCGWLMEPFLQWITVVSCWFSGGGFYRSVPPAWFVPVFLAVLFLTLIFRKRAYAAVSGSILLLFLLFFSVLMPVLRSPEIMLIAANGKTPVILFADPANQTAYAVGMPDSASARIARDLLHSVGIDRIENIFFTSASRDICGGGKNLLCFLNVYSMTFHSRPGFGSKCGPDLIVDAEKKGCSVLYASGPIRFKKGKEARSFRCTASLWKNVVVRYSVSGKNRVVEIDRFGKMFRRIEFPYTPLQSVYRIPLKK